MSHLGLSQGCPLSGVRVTARSSARRSALDSDLAFPSTPSTKMPVGNLRPQRRLAADVLGVGKKKVRDIQAKERRKRAGIKRTRPSATIGMLFLCKLAQTDNEMQIELEPELSTAEAKFAKAPGTLTPIPALLLAPWTSNFQLKCLLR